jgi:Erv1 / Alr family
MDTRFWGPSGWQLFHLIAEGSPSPTTTLMQMGRILPCKFCRESTTNFISESPLAKGMDAGRWLYEIHRKVNHKLATQAKTDPKVILPDPDPTYDDVKHKYADMLSKTPRAVPGRDFLFSIAYNYPETPEYEDIDVQQIFLRTLRKTYPFPALRKVYAAYMDSHPIVLDTRSGYLHWMYGLLKRLSIKTKSPLRTFKGYAHHVAYYKSGCAKSTYHGKTCRRLDNGSYTKQRDHKRTRRVVSGGLLS